MYHMKIALLGYGKMGKMIERIAQERGHEIILTVDDKNREDFISEKLKQADVGFRWYPALQGGWNSGRK